MSRMNARSSKQASGGIGKPLTVGECVKQAQEYTFDVDIPLKIYVRSFRMIFKEANIYWGEGNLSQAYVLMFRASDLVLKKMGTHPESKTPEGRKMIKDITGQAGQVIRDLETLKPLVEAQHEEWERMSGPKKRHSNGYHEDSPPSKTRPGKGYSPTVLDPNDHQNESLNEVLRDVSQKAAARKGTRTSRGRYMEKGRNDDVHGRYSVPSSRETDEDETRRQMEAARRQLDATDPYRFRQEQEITPATSYSSFAPSYPALRPSRPVDIQPRPASPSPRPPFPPPTTSLPPRPPKSPPRKPKSPPRPSKYSSSTSQSISSFNSFEISGPSRPGKIPLEPFAPHLAQVTNDVERRETFTAPVPIRPPKIEERSVPQEIDASPKEEFVFKMADRLESGEPLRALFLPSTLRERFLSVAKPNTAKGYELCGFLCGKLKNNALIVTHLLIPKQVSTENTCDTTNEEEMIWFCEEQDLLIMGWIHTHPTQTCFLSSRDLHTHAPYQCQLAESIAVVCAPKYDEYGIFRCTDPPGKQEITKCRRAEVFHPHNLPDDKLYKSAMAPEGHVTESSGCTLTLFDMRSDEVQEQ